MSYTFKTDKPIGEIIGVQVGDLRPLIDEWRRKNPKAPASALLRQGLKLALKPLAGKRYAHLVETDK
jgi:hypothetical protein